MNFTNIFMALGLGVAVLAMPGCASETDSEDATIEDPGEASDDVVSGKKFHYEPIAPEVIWKPGCGVRPPAGHTCEMGLFVKFTRRFIDLQVTESAQFDKDSNTVTVKLDTWSKSKVHPFTKIAMMPQELPVEAKGLPGLGHYKARIVDWNNKEIFAGDITAMPAP